MRAIIEKLRISNLINNFRDLFLIIDRHNLFLLSSAISYYAALAIAPFLVILLVLASFLGPDIQTQIIEEAKFLIAPQVGQTIALIFENINKGVDLKSTSGLIGLGVLLFTSSMVFVQFRYSLDVIYGDWDPERRRSVWEVIKERLFLMLIVVAMVVVLMSTMFLTPAFEYFFGQNASETFVGQTILLYVNFIIFTIIFMGFHFITPSRKRRFIECFEIAVLSSLGFILGKVLLGLYFKHIASSSVYGAAGTFLIFLVWVYYSSFVLFLSVELFLFLKKKGYFIT